MEQIIKVIEDQELPIDDFEIAEDVYFAQINEPAFTINGNQIYANTAAVRVLGDADYVKILINRESKILALKPCSEIELHGYNWVKTKDGKRYPKHRTGLPFVLSLCQMMDWDPDYRYRAIGKRMFAKEEAVLAFDLVGAKPFRKKVTGDKTKRSVLPHDWNGTFGPKYGDYKRTLQFNTFSDFTLLSVYDGKEHIINTDTAAQSEAGGQL